MRYYTLSSLPEYGIHTGYYKKTRCVFGILAPYIVLITFDDNGSFVRLQHKLIKPRRDDGVMEVVYGYDPLKQYKKFIRRITRKGLFRKEAIQVLKFRLDLEFDLFEPINDMRVCSVGIDDYPTYGVTFLLDTVDTNHADFRDAHTELKKWRASKMFRFWWGNGYDMDQTGKCISS